MFFIQSKSDVHETRKVLNHLFKIKPVSLKYPCFYPKQAEHVNQPHMQAPSLFTVSHTGVLPIPAAAHLYKPLHRQQISRMQFLAGWKQTFKVDFCHCPLFVNPFHKPESKMWLQS